MGAQDKTDRFEKLLVKHNFLIYWNALKNENKKPIERKKKHSVENSLFFEHSDFTWNQFFWDSRSAKYAILTHLEALNVDFHELLQFLKAEMYQINKNWQKQHFRTNFPRIDFT